MGMKGREGAQSRSAATMAVHSRLRAFLSHARTCTSHLRAVQHPVQQRRDRSHSGRFTLGFIYPAGSHSGRTETHTRRSSGRQKLGLVGMTVWATYTPTPTPTPTHPHTHTHAVLAH